LEATLDTTDAWIVARTGIIERRKVAPGENTSDLAVAATRRALSGSGWSPTDLDLIVCATSSAHQMLPSAATHMAQALGTNAVAFDVNAACAGFAYGIATARSMMPSMGFRKAALCCADAYTKFVDYTDRATAVLFGDGAATALLQTERPVLGAEVVDVVLDNWHEGVDLVYVPVGGTWQMQGRKVSPPALRMLANCANRVLKRNALQIGDLRVFVAHQANYRMLEALVEELGVAEQQHWSNVRMYGNQGAAGVLTTLCAGLEQHASDLHDGDLILLTVVGAGFAAGAVLLRWIRKTDDR
jgi:3-oxoacyl-[acyl-carrier-protein] synthase-3